MLQGQPRGLFKVGHMMYLNSKFGVDILNVLMVLNEHLIIMLTFQPQNPACWIKTNKTITELFHTKGTSWVYFTQSDTHQRTTAVKLQENRRSFYIRLQAFVLPRRAGAHGRSLQNSWHRSQLRPIVLCVHWHLPYTYSTTHLLSLGCKKAVYVNSRLCKKKLNFVYFSEKYKKLKQKFRCALTSYHMLFTYEV